jgi:hypothetical protein
MMAEEQLARAAEKHPGLRAERVQAEKKATSEKNIRLDVAKLKIWSSLVAFRVDRMLDKSFNKTFNRIKSVIFVPDPSPWVSKRQVIDETGKVVARGFWAEIWIKFGIPIEISHSIARWAGIGSVSDVSTARTVFPMLGRMLTTKVPDGWMRTWKVAPKVLKPSGLDLGTQYDDVMKTRNDLQTALHADTPN